MLYQWLYQFSDQIGFLNIFQYISVRSFLSFLTSFIACLWFGPTLINTLKNKQMRQGLRENKLEGHIKKAGTPTMGGWLMIFSILVSSILWIDLDSPLVLGVLLLTLGFAAIGHLDDYKKVKNKAAQSGLSGRLRLLLEFTISISVLWFLWSEGHLSSEVHVPVFKNFIFDLGPFYIIFGSLVIVSCANSVNLTDGLDGLAIVPVIVCATTFMAFSYIAGHYEFANYLLIPFVPGASEVTPLAASVMAAGLGFLWFNAYPAQVFMGDVGSLGMGGFLGSVAVVTKNELLLILLGGVFVFEAISVIIQVLYYKRSRKRIFRMAPIHHHFELKGIEENKIIVRFWIISVVLAVLSMATLKIR